MNLKIIFAPFILATMLDYTPTLSPVSMPINIVSPLRSSSPNFGGQALQQKQETFAYNTALLILTIFQSGYKCTLGEAFRTHEQALVYSKTGVGIVNSKHCERLAIDLNLFDKNGKYVFEDCNEYEILGAYWMSLNPHNVWGGHWIHRSDPNHFEAD